jgi:hypothetical protein
VETTNPRRETAQTLAVLSSHSIFDGVSSIQEIEKAVSSLSKEELKAFRAWFQEFDAEAWDRQFEADVKAGRLDKLADEALSDLDEGRCTDL